MKFKIFARNEVIGETLLENGDPPMGVAFGALIPNENYFKYQEYFCKHDFEKISDLELAVVSESGLNLNPIGEVGIEDYSKEMGEFSAQVNALGIEGEVYNQLFPHHVAAYEAQFK
ncbi:hypothetical protein [Microbulbifer celer]|uniref:Uncharacterized protein n=1 Tax=Microbulbifer celer TaxID=435905 RepID=A0ABW3UF17_9GAMM|nr:hypothetical protein [Microbulbifer celer]UFN55885.1 hypothetical protein LPW13_09855 [Microbulbifer celer]